MLLLHSSDEMYGSDRMLLEFLGALPADRRRRAVVWLPVDVPHGQFTLCQQLAERGIAFEHVDLPVIRRRYLNVRGMTGIGRRLAALRQRLRQADPEMVVLATSAVLPAAWALPRSSDRLLVLHLQEVWEGGQGAMLGLLARRVDRVVAISEAARRGVPPSVQGRTTVVPNATADPGAWRPIEPEGAGPLAFLVASRWMPWKGHEVLLRAWDLAGSPGRLVILGGPPAAGAATDVEGLVASAAQPETIQVIGEVADVDPYLREADVMVVPSVRDEPFGLVAIEAFARGRPVVASDNGGLREIVVEGAGWVVPPNDEHALAARLSSLSRAEVAAAGVAARRRFEAHYSRPAFVAGLRAALGLADSGPSA